MAEQCAREIDERTVKLILNARSCHGVVRHAARTLFTFKKSRMGYSWNNLFRRATPIYLVFRDRLDSNGNSPASFVVTLDRCPFLRILNDRRYHRT